MEHRMQILFRVDGQSPCGDSAGTDDDDEPNKDHIKRDHKTKDKATPPPCFGHAHGVWPDTEAVAANDHHTKHNPRPRIGHAHVV